MELTSVYSAPKKATRSVYWCDCPEKKKCSPAAQKRAGLWGYTKKNVQQRVAAHLQTSEKHFFEKDEADRASKKAKITAYEETDTEELSEVDHTAEDEAAQKDTDELKTEASDTSDQKDLAELDDETKASKIQLALTASIGCAERLRDAIDSLQEVFIQAGNHITSELQLLNKQKKLLKSMDIVIED